MTPDLEKEIIVGIMSALFTALFTGVPALLLFWWTWQRDQERLIVQKLVWFATTIDGKRIHLRGGSGPQFGILIRNRSLFPVHVSAAGFQIDGEVIQLEHPYFESKMKKNPDPQSNRPYIPDEDADVREIASQGSTKVSVHDPTHQVTLSAALSAAAEKHKVSAEDILMSGKVMAMVATETGRIFTSLPLLKRLWRRALEIKREMDGRVPEPRT
jgi:hypothetical protein